MSTEITAPPPTSSEEFSGYDGTSMDMCAKLTALMAQTEKIRLILDTYVNPDTMKYRQEALYPGLLPPGAIVPFKPNNGDLASIRREVWRLQRTAEDLDGKDTDDQLKTGAIWTMCDGAVVGSSQSPDLRGRFIVGVGEASGNRSARGVNSSGGMETVILVEDEMPAHTHGPLTASNVAHGSGSTIHGSPEIPSLLVSLDTTFATAAIKDSVVGSTGENWAHENMPPFFALVYIMRTNRIDSTSPV